MLGLILVGASVTYLVVPPVAAPAKITTLDVGDPAIPADGATGGSTGATVGGQGEAPSLIGLPLDTARLALRDAGLGAVEVTTGTSPAAGPPGLIIAQVPAAGAVVAGTVVLTLSTEVKMPALTGSSYDEALAQLQTLGAVVTTTTTVRPDLALGTVLGSTPAAGDPVPAVVDLNVADPGDAVTLGGDLYPTGGNGSCNGDSDVTVSKAPAVTATTALVCTVDGTGPATAVYDLRGLGLVLTFDAALDADSGPGSGSITVLGDGLPLATVAATATPAAESVDVSGVQKLTVSVTGTPSGDLNVGVVLANAVVRGTPTAITDLIGQQ